MWKIYIMHKQKAKNTKTLYFHWYNAQNKEITTNKTGKNNNNSTTLTKKFVVFYWKLKGIEL